MDHGATAVVQRRLPRKPLAVFPGATPLSRRYDHDVLIGFALVVAGLTLALRPLSAARFAHQLRFVPYRDDAHSLVGYRYAGGVIAAVGLLLLLLFR